MSKKKTQKTTNSALSAAQQRKLAYQTAKNAIKQQRANNKINNDMRRNYIDQQKHERKLEIKNMNAQGNIRKHNFALESLRESNRTTRFGMAMNAAKESSLGLWNGIIKSNKNEDPNNQDKDTTSNTTGSGSDGNSFEMVK